MSLGLLKWQEGGCRKQQASQPLLHPRKAMDQFILDVISEHVEGKKVKYVM